MKRSISIKELEKELIYQRSFFARFNNKGRLKVYKQLITDLENLQFMHSQLGRDVELGDFSGIYLNDGTKYIRPEFDQCNECSSRQPVTEKEIQYAVNKAKKRDDRRSRYYKYQSDFNNVHNSDGNSVVYGPSSNTSEPSKPSIYYGGGGSKRRLKSSRRVKFSKSKKGRTTRRLMRKHRK